METYITSKASFDIEYFYSKFPTADDVLRAFHPDNWGRFLREQDRCLSSPTITLATLSDYYDYTTTTVLVENQFKGLFDMTSLKEYPQEGVTQAADLFAAQYEHQLTPYSLVLYFVKYSELKDSFREFDLQDIMKQCGKKFLPWWNAKKAQQEQDTQQEQKETPGCGGLENAMVLWMLKGDTDEQIRTMWFYEHGRITDTMIRRARTECEKRKAGEVF